MLLMLLLLLLLLNALLALLLLLNFLLLLWVLSKLLLPIFAVICAATVQTFLLLLILHLNFLLLWRYRLRFSDVFSIPTAENRFLIMPELSSHAMMSFPAVATADAVFSNCFFLSWVKCVPLVEGCRTDG